MRNIKLTLEYDGTAFEGWQLQKPQVRTVQGELQKAIKKIFKKDIRVIGSGRTDSGVHAKGQVANFKTHSDKSLQVILKALNGNLPKDISILKSEEVNLDFHAQYSAKSKTYRYTILNRDVRTAVDRYTCLFFSYKLNLLRMRQEAKTLLGRHDFKSFQGNNVSNKEKNTVRTIYKLDIKRRGEYIYVDIEANGFLYKMVRNIVGTLLDVGTNRLPRGSMKDILSKKNRQAASPTAPAQGLTLWEVKY